MTTRICSECGGLRHEGSPVDLGRIVVLAPAHQTMVVDNIVVHLSDTEAMVAHEIALRAPDIVSKADVFNAVWSGPTKPKTQKIVDIIVKNLRDKMDAASEGSRHLLVSRYGQGVAFATRS